MNVGDEDTDEDKKIHPKTPMPRNRRNKESTINEDLDENGIIDRDEDLYNDDDDVSTSTMHGSDYSLEEYIKEENKINAEKTTIANGKMKKLKQFVSSMKDKGKGLTCKSTDSVITENDSDDVVAGTVNTKDNSKSCSIM